MNEYVPNRTRIRLPTLHARHVDFRQSVHAAVCATYTGGAAAFSRRYLACRLHPPSGAPSHPPDRRAFLRHERSRSRPMPSRRGSCRPSLRSCLRENGCRHAERSRADSALLQLRAWGDCVHGSALIDAGTSSDDATAVEHGARPAVLHARSKFVIFLARHRYTVGHRSSSAATCRRIHRLAWSPPCPFHRACADVGAACAQGDAHTHYWFAFGRAGIGCRHRRVPTYVFSSITLLQLGP